MEHPTHEILTAAKPGMSRERMIGIGLVGLLHVFFIYALATGLAQKIMINVPKELKAEVIAQPQQEVKTTQPPPPTMIVPKNSITPPEIKVETSQPAAIQQPMAQTAPSTATPDTRASGVTSTHTTPPYPSDAKEKGHEGTVTLHITISEQGTVTNATVTKSSGFPELDQQAVSWVTSHWKYKPATAKGVAVASTSDAQVVFSLKNASG